MKIGIDIDNVISNFDDSLLKSYLIHDKKLRNKGIINNNADYIRKGMFDWSKEEEQSFYNNSIEEIAINLKPIEDAPEIINKLKQEGNEIFLISGRDNGEYSNPKQMTISWLEKYHIPYDHLILVNAYDKTAKSKVCIQNKIDIMIEDSYSICKNLKENNIRVLLMNTRFNQKNDTFERVSNWKQIYEKLTNSHVKNFSKKLRVILDTDTFNECDDQFALSYLLTSQEQFEIEAITIAPYHHDNSISVEEGIQKSYNEVLKISNWLKFNTTNKVWKGSTDYFGNGYQDSTDAVKKIIEIALKNEKTYIIAIGAITNIAIAILKEPSIINKIEVIWLGGHSLLSKNNNEFNFKQDIKAVKSVFSSQVKLTIIPCKNVASNLTTSIYELEHYLKGKNELCNYLCKRFSNDGIHEIKTRRVIWDISAIAYLLHPDWFEAKQIDCPMIQEDSAYKLEPNLRKITMIDYLNVNKIFEELFLKLTKEL